MSRGGNVYEVVVNFYRGMFIKRRGMFMGSWEMFMRRQLKFIGR